MKIMVSSRIISWQIDGENVETVADFIFLGSKITADSDCSHKIKRYLLLGRISSVSHVWLWDPMDCSTPFFPVHHQLPELIRTHVHRVGDAIQLSHPLSSPSLCALNPSQHQGLFRVSSSHQVVKLLELQHQSFQWIFRTDFLQDWLLWSPCNTRDSQESSPTPQFKSISSLVLSFLYGPTLTSVHDYWKTIILIIQTFVSKPVHKCQKNQ